MWVFKNFLGSVFSFYVVSNIQPYSYMYISQLILVPNDGLLHRITEEIKGVLITDSRVEFQLLSLVPVPDDDGGRRK
jgi:hypothetical protein